MITSGLVNLYTNDIEESITFYAGLLGLRETFRTPRDGVPEHIEFAAGGFTLGLGTTEAAKRVHGVDAVPGAPAMAIVFWTDDVDAAFARLLEAGVSVTRAPHDAGNGNRSAQIHDPDGNIVEIVAKLS